MIISDESVFQMRFLRTCIILFSVLSILVCGCAAGKRFSLPFGPPDKSLAAMVPVLQEKDRIVATVEIDLKTDQGHYPVRAALIMQKPSYLRLEILPVIGTPDLYLAATPDHLQIFIPSSEEFYSGKPSVENLSRFLPWGFNVEDIVMILTCSFPPAGGKQFSRASDHEDGMTGFNLKSPSGVVQTFWIDKSGRIKKLIRHDPEGREMFQVSYEDYTSENSLAGKITVIRTDQDTSVSLKYTDLKIIRATNLTVFELSVPAGIQKINLD
jgi:hypothetical protein